MPANVSSQPSTKRACDACKIRKVRCSSTTPCTGCVAIGSPCTFNRLQGNRGPRKLRAKTINQIAQSQRCADGLSLPTMEVVRRTPVSPSASIAGSGSGPGPGLPTQHGSEWPLPPLVASPPISNPPAQMVPATITPVATLTLHLCVYRLRMFPLWPIVAVEDLMVALQRGGEVTEEYALANAVAAATIVQLRLDPLKNSAEVVTVESMEREAQRVRAIGQMKLTLNHLTIVFFLHVYHENLEAGGMKSLLHLREAITMAQMMGLHKESSYQGLSLEEQQFRRRVLWLLFVTERGVGILHKLPVVLQSNISFPPMEYDEEVSILPAFRKLVNLYWIFDQSEAFDLIQNCKSGLSTPQSINPIDLSLLQKRLQSVTIELGATNHVQAADFCVTRTWMCTILWRIASSRGLAPASDDPSASLAYPIQIVKEFLDEISRLPATAIESLGPLMELKIYGIACSVVDSISSLETNEAPAPEGTSPRNILDELQRILSSYRTSNNALVEQIKDRVGAMQNSARVPQRERADENHGENASLELQSDQTAKFLLDIQPGQNDSHAMEPSTSYVPDPGNNNSQTTHHQQAMTIDWDSIAEETQMNFGGDIEQSDQSAAFDRFLMSDRVRLVMDPE
ncbi:fungal-specific transcription factor domain-containing protein [Calycina marina]|uniref:Fungal-specific transcription factor domain-containing protein n=1 Tax=Calycina marina TaxID=1763456 RepID=A0A9P7Z5C6_9HELO|nr:fungal-specific transcription factor domain-containing protein [Calycina marina]